MGRASTTRFYPERSNMATNGFAISVALLFQVDFEFGGRVLCLKEVELPEYWGTNRSKWVTEEAEFQVALEF